jgi:DUF971 family protein
MTNDGTDVVATEIRARAQSRILTVAFADGRSFDLPFEYLRTHSPSAEVKGHGPGQETLVLGKAEVGLKAIEPVGQYAIRIVFNDGHDSGLFSWRYLRELGEQQTENWRRYLERVERSRT